MPIFFKILHIVLQLILERCQTDGGPFRARSDGRGPFQSTARRTGALLERGQAGGGPFRALPEGRRPFLHPEERQKVKHISYLITNLHTSYGFLDNGKILREGFQKCYYMHAVANIGLNKCLTQLSLYSCCS